MTPAQLDVIHAARVRAWQEQQADALRRVDEAIEERRLWPDQRARPPHPDDVRAARIAELAEDVRRLGEAIQRLLWDDLERVGDPEAPPQAIVDPAPRGARQRGR